MSIKIVIKKNTYYDSVTLMSISGRIAATAGIIDAVVAMATPMNKEILENVGMMTSEIMELGANDLVVAIKAVNEDACSEAAKMADECMVNGWAEAAARKR